MSHSLAFYILKLITQFKTENTLLLESVIIFFFNMV